MAGHTVKRLAYGALALGLGCVLALGIAEIAVRVRGDDVASLARSLCWQASDLQAHALSDDPFLHFELAAGAVQSSMGPWGPTRASINRHGARGPEMDAEKALGTWRIVCVGGSSMFGAGVSNHQTTCAALGRRVQALAPSGVKVEAWNYGANAYNLAQMAHQARRRMDLLQPDFVLVLLSNTGRRNFLLTDAARAGDYHEVLGMDGWLHPENAPPWPGESEALHRVLLERSAVYRLAAGRYAYQVHTRASALAEESPWATALSQAEARALTAQAAEQGVALLYVPIPGSVYERPDDVYEGLADELFLDIRYPGMPQEYREVHPSAAIHDAWAEHIVAGMATRGLLPTP